MVNIQIKAYLEHEKCIFDSEKYEHTFSPWRCRGVLIRNDSFGSILEFVHKFFGAVNFDFLLQK